jgi:hypothetical protein
MRDNQHHEDVTRESVAAAILAFVDQWERGGCECCSPTVLDDAFDDVLGPDDGELGARLRRAGIALAQAGEYMCQSAEEVGV